MYKNSDNIVAMATMVGKSALNVVRVSGGQCKRFFQELTQTKISPKPNYVYPKYIYSENEKNPFDFASLVYYRGPKSFTGEDSLEVSIHGGTIIANKLIEALILLGARQALPGEFSYRAFSNNKIDILQAEGISSIVEANNSIDSYYLLSNIKGNLSKVLTSIKTNIVKLITEGEHEIDFTEDEMTEQKSLSFNRALLACQKQVSGIVAKSYTEKRGCSGIRVAIIGLPNVGKSSIFNCIVGQSRSIVTDEQGTTRDTVEIELYIGTTLVTLIDTAGLRQTKNKAEMVGIQKTYNEIVNANILMVVDDQNPKKIYNQLKSKIKSQKIILVHNKIDLIKQEKRVSSIYNVSCTKERGFNRLLTQLLTLSKKEINVFNTQYLYLLNKRQNDLLKGIERALTRVLQEHKKMKDLSACLSSLYIIRDDFNNLIQPSNKEDILHSIFKGFCVGK